ncbi:MAG: SRPBCC family protein [Flammeovirgaceae bacterium]
MRLIIKTKVAQSLNEVWKGFSAELFKQLNPPFPLVNLKRFDGSETGNEVHLELNFIAFKSQWVSVITDHDLQDDEIYFIDEGKVLPKLFKYWKHRHRILKDGENSIIVDDITFKSPSVILDILLLPALYLQFLYRIPIYKRVFSK